MYTEEIISKGIQAILPIYVPGRGNSTLVHTDEDNVTIDAAVRTVIRRLCAHYHLDMKASNRYFGGFLSIGQGVPLPLTVDDIFIQIKVRKPIGEADGTMGYFNLDSIQKIEGIGNNSTILLKNGVEVQCLCTEKTIRKNISRGEVVRKLYEQRHSTIGENIEPYMDLNAPATKADIARLFIMMHDVITQIK